MVHQYTHGGYNTPFVRGAFFQELLDLDISELRTTCPALFIHGRDNALHHPDNIAGAAATAGAEINFVDGRHNDFMRFESPQLQKVVRLLADFGSKC